MIPRVEMLGSAGSGKSTIYDALDYDCLSVYKYHDLQINAALDVLEKNNLIFSLLKMLGGLNKSLSFRVSLNAKRCLDNYIDEQNALGVLPFPDSKLLPQAESLAVFNKKQTLLRKIAWLEYIYSVHSNELVVMDEGLVMHTEKQHVGCLPLTGLEGLVYVNCSFDVWYERILQRRSQGKIKGSKNFHRYSFSEIKDRYLARQKNNEDKIGFLEYNGVPVLKVSSENRLNCIVSEVSKFISGVKNTASNKIS